MTHQLSDEQLRLATPFEPRLAIARPAWLEMTLTTLQAYRNLLSRAKERRHLRQIAVTQALSESSPPGA